MNEEATQEIVYRGRDQMIGTGGVAPQDAITDQDTRDRGETYQIVVTITTEGPGPTIRNTGVKIQGQTQDRDPAHTTDMLQEGMIARDPPRIREMITGIDTGTSIEET